MKPNAQFLLGIFVYFSIVAVVSPLKPGTCSNQCKSQQSLIIFGEETKSCSCSSSCIQFGDCCFDSHFRKADTAKLPTVCLPVGGNNLYSAIGSCSQSWRASSEFCLKSIGHLPPVTSLSSGATYTNIYCAICNGDYFNITIWDVDLKCCSKHESKLMKSKRHKGIKVGFYFKEYSLLRKVESRNGRTECLCTFEPRNGKLFVPKSTELRQCQTGNLYLHSSCAFHWRDAKTRQYCMSYFDPVYVYNRVYRNIDCAICNFDDVSESSCIPGIVTLLKRRNMSLKEIRKFCKELNITSCLYYFMSKGRATAFSQLFATSAKECVPEPGNGRKCCRGWKYDYRDKRCRKTYD